MLVAVQLVKEDYQHQSEDEVFCENERIHSNSNSDVRPFFSDWNIFYLSIVVKKTTLPFSTLPQGENVIVPLITDSLEWTLSSPPPLHQFTEPPLIVECEHLALQPGAEVEEVLESQGETITDIVGKEGWVANDPKLYEGLIPQNCEWTEFVDEKTGEWVYLDEYGQRVDKSK